MDMVRNFLRLESASGILLVTAALLAMVMANSPLAFYYNMLIDLPVEVRVGPLMLAKPLLLWINDGLMAIFFFLVGMELKRELLEGELNSIESIVLPGVGALGGILVPAAIYISLNTEDVVAMQGWAIPTATDIAFVLGILALLGERVPASLKMFLVSLAIFDDISAIVIIAFFYTANISAVSLSIAAVCLLLLFLLNWRGVIRCAPYLFIGAIMWIAVLKSGVHATLSGVLLAMFIPLRDPREPHHSLLLELESELHSGVAFIILPLFAFANAGLSLAGITMESLLHPATLGVAAGLFLGKQIGVLTFCWLGVRLGLAKLPQGVNWGVFYGASLLTGVGFTMSLFIGSLAFEETNVNILFDDRLGTIIGSLLSAVSGYLLLRVLLPQKSEIQRDPQTYL